MAAYLEVHEYPHGLWQRAHLRRSSSALRIIVIRPSGIVAQDPQPPNPSVNATSTSYAPGPRGTQAYHLPRGPGAPLAAA
ncbi:hypothetical protein, partial [Pseudaquabacterium terrae]|uniref:hypothetical protein n=1 Tax=Pseudaquabacterium terrae TaxID=2732868 RepID=UPI001C2701D5